MLVLTTPDLRVVVALGKKKQQQQKNGFDGCRLRQELELEM